MSAQPRPNSSFFNKENAPSTPVATNKPGSVFQLGPVARPSLTETLSLLDKSPSAASFSRGGSKTPFVRRSKNLSAVVPPSTPSASQMKRFQVQRGTPSLRAQALLSTPQRMREKRKLTALKSKLTSMKQSRSAKRPEPQASALLRKEAEFERQMAEARRLKDRGEWAAADRVYEDMLTGIAHRLARTSAAFWCSRAFVNEQLGYHDLVLELFRRAQEEGATPTGDVQLALKTYNLRQAGSSLSDEESDGDDVDLLGTPERPARAISRACLTPMSARLMQKFRSIDADEDASQAVDSVSRGLFEFLQEADEAEAAEEAELESNKASEIVARYMEQESPIGRLPLMVAAVASPESDAQVELPPPVQLAMNDSFATEPEDYFEDEEEAPQQEEEEEEEVEEEEEDDDDEPAQDDIDFDLDAIEHEREQIMADVAKYETQDEPVSLPAPKLNPVKSRSLTGSARRVVSRQTQKPVEDEADKMLKDGVERGTMITLAPVRARPAQMRMFGTDAFVSPVRRCRRHRQVGASSRAQEAAPTPVQDEQQMLESTNFAYMPNHALDDVEEASAAVAAAPAPRLSQVISLLEEDGTAEEVFKPVFRSCAVKQEDAEEQQEEEQQEEEQDEEPKPRRSTRNKTKSKPKPKPKTKAKAKSKAKAKQQPVRRSARLRKKRGE